MFSPKCNLLVAGFLLENVTVKESNIRKLHNMQYYKTIIKLPYNLCLILHRLIEIKIVKTQ